MTCEDVEREFGDIMSPGLIEFHYMDGWEDIVRGMLRTIREIAPDAKITQLKEKFGSLRVYHDDGTEASAAVIDAAERLSRRTCCHCGELGTCYSRGGWLMVMCGHCAKEVGWA